jgi:hypothetical protein
MLRASVSSLRTVMLFAALLAMLATLLLAPAAQPAQASHGGTLQVRGVLEDGRKFVGRVSELHASVNDAGRLVISGVLNGRALENGEVVGRVVDEAFRTTVSRSEILQATCEILRLELGPLHLDVLGLQVDLNRVVLVITAVEGPGNLLGNLLCALAGLLDNDVPLSRIADDVADILNRIFALL